jgi:oligoendopeptidase F
MSRLLAVVAAALLCMADAPWHVDLARHYFASPAAEAADRKALDGMVAALAAQRDGLGRSPQALLNALALHEKVLVAYGRHESYLLLRCRSNKTGGTACADLDALETSVDGSTAALESAAARLPSKTVEGFLKREKGLVPYRAWLADAARDHDHLLPPAQEELISRLAGETAGWQDDLYEAALDRADFGTVTTAHGTLDVRRQRNLIAIDPDPAVRRAGFEKRLAGLVSVRDDIAFALLHLAKANNDLAQAHGFANAPDRAYFAMGFAPAAVRGTIARVLAQGELQKRFDRLRAAETARMLGIKEAGPWDLSLPLTAIPSRTPQQAVDEARAALTGLGPWYAAQFTALTDPANGRLDLVPGGAPHRSTGGFSVGFRGADSALFVGTFDGAYKDLSVMVHEGGHAVHRALMAAHGTRPVYQDGPHFLFESFAEFNELVLADALAAKAADPAAKRYYEERFLAVKGLDFIAGAQDAALEQGVYDDAKLSDADGIDRLNLSIAAQVSTWPQRASWEGTSLAFEDPFYDVNYMYASMLALKYFQLYKADPDAFLPRYRALLENGFDDTPRNLMKRFLDIDLDSPALLGDAVTVVDARLKALESLP